jgi:DNA-damage-inducible protein J
MNMTTAFNIFLRQAVRQQRIPFDIALDTPNAETIAAMEEASSDLFG